MNSVANLGVEDVYRRFFPKVSDHQCLVFGRRLTLGLGIFGTVAALLLGQYQRPAVDLGSVLDDHRRGARADYRYLCAGDF